LKRIFEGVRNTKSDTFTGLAQYLILKSKMKNGQYFNRFNWKSLKNDSQLTNGQRLTVDKIIKSIELGNKTGVRALYGGGNRPPIFVPLKSKSGRNLTNEQIRQLMKTRKVDQNRLNAAYVTFTGHGVPKNLWKTLGVSVLLATTTGLGGRAVLGPRGTSTLPVPTVLQPLNGMQPLAPLVPPAQPSRPQFEHSYPYYPGPLHGFLA